MTFVRLTKTFFLTIATSTIFISCNKDKVYSPIQIGVTEMNVKQVNQTMSNTPFTIDFDGDGVDDISFSTGTFGLGPNLSVDQGARTLALRDNLGFLVTTYKDTLFSCTTQSLTNWPVNPVTVALTTVDYQGFTEQNDSCDILDIQTNTRVRYCEENDIISRQDNFSMSGAGTGQLLSRSYVIQDYWDAYVSMDTLYRQGYYTSHYPEYLTPPFPKYIVFKYKNGENERLGWIKLNGLTVQSIAIEKY